MEQGPYLRKVYVRSFVEDSDGKEEAEMLNMTQLMEEKDEREAHGGSK